MARKYEYTAKQVNEAQNAADDLQYKHMGQQATFLENALSKIEQESDGGATRQTKSIRRIVAAMLRGQGVDHPAVDLLKEAGRR